MAMGGAPSARKRALMTPRGLVNLRNGAEMALAGMGDRKIWCDSSVVGATTTRDCAGATTFSSVSAENQLKCLAWYTALTARPSWA
jgi:hypothetical protein